MKKQHIYSLIGLFAISILFLSCGDGQNTGTTASVTTQAKDDSADQKKNNTIFWQLQENVKEVREVNYLPKEENGSYVKGERHSGTDYKFNEEGNLVELTNYDKYGNETDITGYRYNDQGYMAEEITYYPDGSKGMRTSYKYDAAGNVIEKQEIEPRGGMRGEDKIYTYQYDKNGNLMKEKLLMKFQDSGDSSIFITGYLRDKNGIMTGKELSGDDGLLRKYAYKADENGNPTEETEFFPDGKPARKNIMKYNEKGEEIEIARYDADGVLNVQEVKTYDADGNCTSEQVLNADGELVRGVKYSFDEMGNILSLEQMFGERQGTETVYRYKYDDNKNWLQREDVVDERLTYVIEREIDYYN